MTVHVGFDGAMLSAPYTGSGQYSAALVEALRALPGVLLTVLAPSPIPSEPEAFVVPPPRALSNARLRKVWWEQIGIARAAKEVGVQVIHIPYFAAPLRQDIPCVVTVHDVIPLILPAYAGGMAMRTYLRLVTAGARRAAEIIADSDCSRRDAIRMLRIDAAHVTTIPLAAGREYGLPRDEPLIRELRHRFGLEGKRVVFNSAGLDTRKNVGTLVRAFARVHAALGDSVRLVIGGGAHGNRALYPDPRPLAAELGIAESVILPGVLTTAEKVACYQLADCYVAPSVYEGFGMTPLEAMACGCPVVAADASCTPEVVGDAVLLVPPYDIAGFAAHITRVITDAALADDLRRRGLAQAAAFGWDRTASASRAIYERAAGARGNLVRTMSTQTAETGR